MKLIHKRNTNNELKNITYALYESITYSDSSIDTFLSGRQE